MLRGTASNSRLKNIAHIWKESVGDTVALQEGEMTGFSMCAESQAECAWWKDWSKYIKRRVRDDSNYLTDGGNICWKEDQHSLLQAWGQSDCHQRSESQTRTHGFFLLLRQLTLTILEETAADEEHNSSIHPHWAFPPLPCVRWFSSVRPCPRCLAGLFPLAQQAHRLPTAILRMGRTWGPSAYYDCHGLLLNSFIISLWMQQCSFASN